MNLARFAVQRKSLVIAGLVLAIFWSLFAGLGMQRREDPGTTQRQTAIVTTYAGATTQNVEQLVTKKITEDIRGVAHVEHVEGVSRPGISVVTVVFDDTINSADTPLRDVRNHIDDLRAQLPSAASAPGLVEDVWKTYPIIVGISAPDATPRELRDFAKNLNDAIAALPDVGVVHLVGAQEQQVSVDLDVAALTQYGITAGDLTAALAARNTLIPSGAVALSGRLAQVDPSRALRNSTDVGQTAVRATEGRIVRVADLARVGTAYPDPPTELVRVDGAPGVALAIEAKETSSVTELGPEVRRFLDTRRASWPASVHVAMIADQPKTVDARVGDFALNLVLAVIIVTGLVALFMGLRNGLLVGVTVVLSIVLTFGGMKLLSIDINQISLLALIISLGIIVDAGIVAIDNIEHHLRAGLDRTEAAVRGVGELWLPLLTSTLVAMSSFLPFRLMGGSVGDFVRDLGVVTCISLAMSLVVAYFVTPILGEWFAVSSSARTGVRAIFDRGLDSVRRGYVPLATAALHRPVIAATLAGIAVLAAAMWIPHLGVQFFPSADRDQFQIEINAADGTDIRTTERIAHAVETIVVRAPGVTTVGTFVGAGAPRFYYNVTSEQPKPSYAQIIVNTIDIAAANRLVPAIGERIKAIPGARITVKALEQGPPVGAPIQVRLSGSDPRALALGAMALETRLAKVRGAVNVRTSLGEPTTKLDATIDDARAASIGVDDRAVGELVALAFGGMTATQIRERDRQTPVVVRLPPGQRTDIAAFGALSVRTRDGRAVPLAEFATLAPRTQTSVATLRDGIPVVSVLGDVDGRLASDVLAEFRRSIPALPPGITIAYAGEDEQTTKSFTNLLVAVIVGLLINQMVLLFEFRTLRLSLVVLAAVPLGLVGAIAGLAIMGQHFGFVASLGISSLGGIVTNHAIVLFEYAKREMASGLPMERALIVAGTKRLRPILLTVIASIAGLLPLAFSAQSLWRPFCWAVIFGLSGSMIMTLIVIPAIYRLVGTRTTESTSEAIDRGSSFVGAS